MPCPSACRGPAMLQCRPVFCVSHGVSTLQRRLLYTSRTKIFLIFLPSLGRKRLIIVGGSCPEFGGCELGILVVSWLDLKGGSQRVILESRIPWSSWLKIRSGILITKSLQAFLCAFSLLISHRRDQMRTNETVLHEGSQHWTCSLLILDWGEVWTTITMTVN